MRRKFFALAVLVAAASAAVYEFGTNSRVGLQRRECQSAADCNNRGTCSSIGQCDCNDGYAGFKCRSVCRGTTFHANGTVNVLCSGHGTCSQSLGGRCRCTSGYIGNDCGTALPTPTPLSSPSAGESTASSVTLNWPAPTNENEGGQSTFQGTTYQVEGCVKSSGCDSGGLSQAVVNGFAEDGSMAQSMRGRAVAAVPTLGSTASSSNWQVVCVTSGRGCNATGLQEGTLYVFCVRAKFNRGSFGNCSALLEQATQARVPSYETNTPIVNGSVTSTSIRVDFVPPRDIGGGSVNAAVKQYKVEFKKSSLSSWSEQEAPEDATSLTLSGLDVFTSYDIRIYARNVAGYGDPSSVVTQKTAGACGNSVIEAGSLSNGLSYSEACDGGFCCTGSCALADSSACSGHGTCANGTACSCQSGYVGAQCQHSGATLCSGHGTVNGDLSCSCENGYYGTSCSITANDCMEVKASVPGGTSSGIYYIHAGGSTPHRVYCDQTTQGGGWTMCTTDNDRVRISSELSGGTYGSDGYRADCRNVEFNAVMYINHDSSNAAAVFHRESSTALKYGTTNYNVVGSTYGKWAAMTGSSTLFDYQLLICDASWMYTGLFMSGIHPSGSSPCYKSCNGWCNDGTSPYFRYNGDFSPETGALNGVAFNENGHRQLTSKLVSVGVRKNTVCSSGQYHDGTQCVACGCSGTGSTSTTCNVQTGACSCKNGYYGRTCSITPTDCVDVRDTVPGGKTSGSYYVHQNSAIFQVYCNQDDDGGGWTMCSTDNFRVRLQSELSGGTYGSDGYRADCRNIPFNAVLYINHNSGAKAWFYRDSTSTIRYGTTNYNVGGSTYGLWTVQSGATSSYKYQLNICDNGWMYVGLMMTGYTSCYKQCGSWCGDTSTPYFRYDGDFNNDSGNYGGVSFNENGHTNVASKLVSVGIKRR